MQVRMSQSLHRAMPTSYRPELSCKEHILTSASAARVRTWVDGCQRHAWRRSWRSHGRLTSFASIAAQLLLLLLLSAAACPGCWRPNWLRRRQHRRRLECRVRWQLLRGHRRLPVHLGARDEARLQPKHMCASHHKPIPLADALCLAVRSRRHAQISIQSNSTHYRCLALLLQCEHTLSFSL